MSKCKICNKAELIQVLKNKKRTKKKRNKQIRNTKLKKNKTNEFEHTNIFLV